VGDQGKRKALGGKLGKQNEVRGVVPFCENFSPQKKISPDNERSFSPPRKRHLNERQVIREPRGVINHQLIERGVERTS